MTSLESPTHTDRSDALAAALPTLVVRDITDDVAAALAAAAPEDGIAFLRGEPGTLVRVQEREAGFFCDIEELTARVVGIDVPDRVRHLAMLLGSGTEQIPFMGRKLCLGTWQRVMLFDLEGRHRSEWTLAVVG